MRRSCFDPARQRPDGSFEWHSGTRSGRDIFVSSCETYRRSGWVSGGDLVQLKRIFRRSRSNHGRCGKSLISIVSPELSMPGITRNSFSVPGILPRNSPGILGILPRNSARNSQARRLNMRKTGAPTTKNNPNAIIPVGIESGNIRPIMRLTPATQAAVSTKVSSTNPPKLDGLLRARRIRENTAPRGMRKLNHLYGSATPSTGYELSLVCEMYPIEPP